MSSKMRLKEAHEDNSTQNIKDSRDAYHEREVIRFSSHDCQNAPVDVQSGFFRSLSMWWMFLRK